MKKDKIFTNKLLDESVAYAFKNCIPLFTSIEITLACNLKCHHCYNFDRSQPLSSLKNESSLSTPEILDAINQVAKAGALYINLTGGEVLLHPDVELFVAEIVKNHSLARIKSNAILLTKDKSERLFRSGLNAVDISLYGANEKTYLSFTGKEGFEKTISGALNARDAGIDVHFNIVLHRENAKDLQEMIDLMVKHDFSYAIGDEITERYDGSSGSKTAEISSEQFESLLLSEIGQKFMYSNPDKALQCSCARTVCGISSSGEVFPCIGAPIKAGSLRENTFAEIWETSEVFKNIRELTRTDFKECQSCDYIESCARSSGAAYANTGEYTSCDKSSLMRAKVRHKHKSKFNL